MNLSAIKIKIIALIIGVGLVLSFLLAIYSPNQAQKLGNEILRKDTEFIAGLLAENLALGMQTRILDDGATLEQTLGLLRQNKGQSAISNVWVYDENKKPVVGLNSEKSARIHSDFNDEFMLEDNHDILKATLPLQDSDKIIIGYFVRMPVFFISLNIFSAFSFKTDFNMLKELFSFSNFSIISFFSFVVTLLRLR